MRSVDLKRVLVALFGVFLSFNLGMALVLPVRAFCFLRRFQLILPGMTSSEVGEVLGERVRILSDGEDWFWVPLYLFDSPRTYATISYESGVVKETKMPFGSWSGWPSLVGWMWPRIFIASTFAVSFAGGIRISRTKKWPGGVLAGITFLATFAVAFWNLFILPILASL